MDMGSSAGPKVPLFTGAGVLAGLIAGQPMAVAILAYAVAFGVLAHERNISVIEATLMSAFAYSGSAQLAVLNAWQSQKALAPALLIVLIMNARYFFYSAALRPWLGAARPMRSYFTLFFLGDSNWALSMGRYAQGYVDAGFILGSGISTYVPWVLGTAIGSLFGAVLGDMEALALDFLLVAFSTALAVRFWKRSLLMPALAAAVVGLTCAWIAPGGWVVVASSSAGIAVSFCLAPEQRQ